MLKQPRHILLAALGLALPFMVYRNSLFLINSSDPAWQTFKNVRWTLILHVVFGFTALLIGPLQFSTRFRRQRTALHRTFGKIYVVAVCIGAPSGFYIGLNIYPASMASVTTAMALGWLTTTVVAFIAARNRNLLVHRQWMIRSYVFTAIFVTSRVLFAIPAIAKLSEQPAAIVGWSLVFVGLLLADIGIDWSAVTRNRQAKPLMPENF